MRYLSVCSGIEAASVAWEPLGWEPVGFAEIEKFPAAVLARHWPEVPNLGDLTKHDEWPDTLRPDLVVGGTPCQAFSVAGLRQGLADPRGNLTLVFLGVLAQFRPRWVVWENVPGVLSDKTGAFGAFLGGLGELGYGFAYRVLDAQYFGVAQRRRRVFVVGCLGDWRAAAAVLFEPESLRGDPAPSRAAGEGAAHDVAPCLGASGRGFERTGDTRGQDAVIAEVSPTLRAGGNCTGGDRPPGTDVDTSESLIAEIANPLTARMHKGINTTMDEGQTMIAHALRGEGFDASEDGTGRGTPIVPVAFERRMVRTSGGQPQEQLAHCLRADQNTGDGAPCVAHCFDARQTDVLQYGDKTGPLDTGFPGPAIATPMCVRRLTPRECERLQGFPDDHTLIPWKAANAWMKQNREANTGETFEEYLKRTTGRGLREPTTTECPDGPRYKALGNSMAVPVMRWIGEGIAAVEGMR